MYSDYFYLYSNGKQFFYFFYLYSCFLENDNMSDGLKSKDVSYHYHYLDNKSLSDFLGN